MAHPVAHAGLLEVAVEHLVVLGGLVLEALDLLRAPVVAGVRVDGDQLDAGVGRRGQDDHRPAPEASRSRRSVPPGRTVRAQVHRRRAWPGVIHPSTSATTRLDLVEGAWRARCGMRGGLRAAGGAG